MNDDFTGPALAAGTVLGVRAFDIDRLGRLTVALPAAGVMLLGLCALFLVREAVAVVLAGAVMMSGFMVVTAALSAEIRDRTPPEMAGHFQGKRDLIKGVGAALAILAMMGASGERVDLMAHFFSLACGLILGLAMGLISKAGQKIPSLISTLAGLAAILLVGLSWLEAIAKGSVD